MEHTSPDGARGPCAGFRVVDFSTVVSGPLCTQILGDLGADVVKVETPRGDISRMMGPPFRGGQTPIFSQFNRNKRSIVVDLKQAEGVEVEVHMIGKKGIARFRYTQRDVHEKYIEFDDQSTFAQTEAILELKLYRLARLEINVIREELESKRERTGEIQESLGDEDALRDIVLVMKGGVVVRRAAGQR